MTNPLRSANHDGVLLLEIDNPPVNALSPGVPEAIAGAIASAGDDASVRAVIIKGAGSTFIAGADIAMLEDAAWGNRDAAADLHGLLAGIEDCAKPIVMAIHGTALGGGLELAMAGHYRVATADAVLGQPEVNLGIIPGAEGTQRLPRLVGVEQALEMCVTGVPLKAQAALDAGLIDALIEGDLAAGAIRFAGGITAQDPSSRRTRLRTDRLGSPGGHAGAFAAARELAAKVKRRQVAPLKAIEAIAAAASLPFADGCRRERELFFECVESEQAKALIHLFFAERTAARLPGPTAPPAAAPVAHVAVVGAGTMGGGIAMACANAGLAVTLKDATQAALDAGLAAIQRNYDASVRRGRMTADAVRERLARIRPTLGDDDVASADVVIEAVFENLELKKQVFRDLDARAKPAAILASNTSTLGISIKIIVD